MRVHTLVVSLLCLATTVAGCAPGPESGAADQQTLPAHEEVEVVSSAISVCGLTPTVGPCQRARCNGEFWEIEDRPNGTACSNSCGQGTCQNGSCDTEIRGSLDPRYYVMSVVYSPPGTTGSGPKSTVTYGNGAKTGTETKTGSSFKHGVSVTAQRSIAGFVSISGSAGYSVTNGSSNSLAISKKEETQISASGGTSDGIDHDRDAIWLWLNPRVNLAICGSKTDWTLGTRGASDMRLQYVYVGHLKDPTQMPPGVANELAAHGITPAEYPNILTHNPYANGSPLVDSGRFVQTTTSFPYEPPYAPGDAPMSYQLTLTNETTSSNTSSYERQYKVGVEVSGGNKFTQWAGLSLKVNAEFVWTNSKQTTSSTTTTESATVRVTGPSFGYTGPTNLAVYYDTLYKTFMFKPITYNEDLGGIVVDVNGLPVAHQLVTMTVNGVRHQTVTGLDGSYRFFDAEPGAGEVKVGDVVQPISVRTVRARLAAPPITINRPIRTRPVIDVRPVEVAR